MNKFLPDAYYNSIYDINFTRLKELGINTLIFDFDNTIIEKGNNTYTKKQKMFFEKLKKDFRVVILSNTKNRNKQKIQSFCNLCDIDYVTLALKPLKKGFKKIKNKYNLELKDMCMIGDQLLTDILGSKRFGIYSILINGISKDELRITKFNRKIEAKIEKILYRKYGFKRGSFYD